MKKKNNNKGDAFPWGDVGGCIRKIKKIFKKIRNSLLKEAQIPSWLFIIYSFYGLHPFLPNQFIQLCYYPLLQDQRPVITVLLSSPNNPVFDHRCFCNVSLRDDCNQTPTMLGSQHPEWMSAAVESGGAVGDDGAVLYGATAWLHSSVKNIDRISFCASVNVCLIFGIKGVNVALLLFPL